MTLPSGKLVVAFLAMTRLSIVMTPVDAMAQELDEDQTDGVRAIADLAATIDPGS